MSLGGSGTSCMLFSVASPTRPHPSFRERPLCGGQRGTRAPSTHSHGLPERITTAGIKHMGDLELILLASVASLVCLIASLWINNEGSMG